MFDNADHFARHQQENPAMNWEQIPDERCCACCRDAATPVGYMPYCVKVKDGYSLIMDADFNKKIHTRYHSDTKHSYKCCHNNPGKVLKVKASEVSKVY